MSLKLFPVVRMLSRPWNGVFRSAGILCLPQCFVRSSAERKKGMNCRKKKRE